MSQFEVEKAAEYKASAYVWSDAGVKVDIICNGIDMHVTRNLRGALVCLCGISSPNAIWADALCMNQFDIEKKTVHVLLMGRIYSRAANTVMCKGTEKFKHVSRVQAALRTVNDWLR